VADGAGVVALGNVNNDYSGQTRILSGTLLIPTLAALTCTNIFGYPQSYGTDAILLGDTSGTNNATLQFSSSATTTFTNYLPIHVQAGSSGAPTLMFGNNSARITAVLQGQLTLDRTLNVLLAPEYGNWLYLTNRGPISGPGCLFLNGYQSPSLTIAGPNNTYSGGTFVSSVFGTSDMPTPFTLSVAPNATLGVGDVTLATGTTWLYGDRNIGGGDCYGNNTISRQARLSVEPFATVYFMSANPSVGSLSGSGDLFLTNTTLTVGGDNGSTLFDGILNQCAASAGRLCKTGSGCFTFKGFSSLAGTTEVNGGTFVVDGAMTGGVTVNSGATLAGAGAVGALTLNSGAVLLTGNTVTNGVATNRMSALSASSLALNAGATVHFNIYSRTNYDQLVISGPVDLNGVRLEVSCTYAPSASDVFYLVLNQSTNATSGAFDALPEGARVDLGNGYAGGISYTGTGDATAGNDVAIRGVTRSAGAALFFR
jgi:autotransporter-associated beta strand protein